VARRIDVLLTEAVPPPKPPPTRSGFLTRAQVRATIAECPDWPVDLRGDLQVHTTHSDGSASVPEMARALGALGYEYAAITDHSRSLRIANGMDEARLAAAGEEIARTNDELRRSGARLRLLRSIEMDLSTEGEGDMEVTALASLDLVLGAFHSGLRSKDDETERFLKALANPTVHVLAHPRGRRYDHRGGLRADMRRVAARAAELDKALEIDAYPDRQDLAVADLRCVVEAGGRISLGTDAHHPDELLFMEFGLAAAIRAGVPRERILNFLPVEDLLRWSRR
jgi:DNA polymerase (family 10)